MGVYIKGMRMPENCIKCPMQFGGMCYVMPAEVDESRVAPTVEEALKQGKPDWCPLVEIPEPHGDLIYRDALEADICPDGTEGTVRSMTLEQAIEHAEDTAKSAIRCECREEHRQLASWLSILKKAKFEYDEAWRIITHPTPDVTYADRDRAQVILETFKDSLGRLEV